MSEPERCSCLDTETRTARRGREYLTNEVRLVTRDDKHSLAFARILVCAIFHKKRPEMLTHVWPLEALPLSGFTYLVRQDCFAGCRDPCPVPVFVPALNVHKFTVPPWALCPVIVFAELLRSDSPVAGRNIYSTDFAAFAYSPPWALCPFLPVKVVVRSAWHLCHWPLLGSPQNSRRGVEGGAGSPKCPSLYGHRCGTTPTIDFHTTAHTCVLSTAEKRCEI